jgi:hypothetical protein
MRVVLFLAVLSSVVALDNGFNVPPMGFNPCESNLAVVPSIIMLSRAPACCAAINITRRAEWMSHHVSLAARP